MKKRSSFLILFGMAAFILVACGDKVADPEALYQKYLKDTAARQSKISECRLLSIDEQSKSQSCTIAFKADGDSQMKNNAKTNWKPVQIDLGLKKTKNKE